MFAGLVLLLLGINGANVLNSYVGRDFMTAIGPRNKAAFVQGSYILCWRLSASTIVAVLSRFTEERFGAVVARIPHPPGHQCLSPRRNLLPADEKRGIGQSGPAHRRGYPCIHGHHAIFILMLLNSAFTVVAFSGVLWLISPLLFGVAGLYAACGSFVTLALGVLFPTRPRSARQGSDFRSELIHVRENAEPILLAHREDRLGAPAESA